MTRFSFEILHTDRVTRARRGLIHTTHGDIQTPCFVPVATLASVRALDSRDMISLGADCTLANTYHLHLRPGDDLIRRLGGLHDFMGFPRPIITDSGGFQAFSLGLGREHDISKIGSIFPEGKRSVGGVKRENLTRIDDEGITFRSIYDGRWHTLDVKKSMEIQSNLGADIIMAFDECTSPLSDYDYTRVAMERTHRWAEASLEHHDREQSLYGIVQGGWFQDLRLASTRFIRSLPFEGIAIGGSLGNCKEDMHQVLDWVVPLLDDRPRHLLGIGEVDDIFQAVERGVDSFDCVTPTRIARRGTLFLSSDGGGCPANRFRINIKAAKFREDTRPPDQACCCPVCRSYSRAYLRHLYTAGELSYFRLASMHNLHFMLRLMEDIRDSISQGKFLDLKARWLGETAPLRR